ncbi:hypothetical protein V5K00_RS22215 [Enterobacter asburiae]
MNKTFMLFPALFLSGCVNLGKIGTHPDVASFYINHTKSQVADCLIYASSKEHLFLEFDEFLPDGSEKYNLQDKDSTDVAWVEVSRFSGKQSIVEVYYAPHDLKLHESILAIANQCK